MLFSHVCLPHYIILNFYHILSNLLKCRLDCMRHSDRAGIVPLPAAAVAPLVLCLQNSLGFIVWHPTFQGVLPTLLLVQDGNVFARVRHCSHHRKHISIVAKSTRCPTLQDCKAFLSLVSYPLYWEFSNTSVPVWVQPPPKDVRVQLTGDSKLAILIDLRVCLSASSCGWQVTWPVCTPPVTLCQLG